MFQFHPPAFVTRTSSLSSLHPQPPEQWLRCSDAAQMTSPSASHLHLRHPLLEAAQDHPSTPPRIYSQRPPFEKANKQTSPPPNSQLQAAMLPLNCGHRDFPPPPRKGHTLSCPCHHRLCLPVLLSLASVLLICQKDHGRAWEEPCRDCGPRSSAWPPCEDQLLTCKVGVSLSPWLAHLGNCLEEPLLVKVL